MTCVRKPSIRLTLTLRSLLVVALATFGLVAGAAQRSLGDGSIEAADSVLASVTITSPTNGDRAAGEFNVQAEASGPDGDQPRTIQFFIDDHKRPVASVDCVPNADNPSYYCGARWVWQTAHKLVG